MSEIARLFATVGADTSGFARSMAGVDDRLHATGKGFNALGAVGGAAIKGIALAASATVAAIGALSAATVVFTKSAMDMQQQVADIGATMGLTADQMAQVDGLISDLGLDPNLKVSAVQAGEAIENLGKNGIALADIMDGAARSTVLLANSTGANFGQAADIVSDAMAQFGISAENMQGAVDQITGVTIASKFTIDDYALALGQAGGVASAVGVSFEDFNATIAAISPLFSSGSDAGTSFKTFLQRLIPQSDDAMEAMKALGLITADGRNQFFDAAGQMKDMSEVAGILNRAFAGLSEEQKNAAASTIFGTDAMRAAFALAGMATEQFKAMSAQIGDTDAAAAAAKRMDTLAGSLEIFRGVMETVSIGIGKKFLPVATRLAKWATDLLSKYSQPLIEWFGKLATSVEGVAGRLTGAFDRGGLKGVGTELVAMGKEWASALGGWAVNLWARTAPTLAAYAANLVVWATSSATWRAIGQAMQSAAGAFSGWARDLWPRIAPALGQYVRDLLAWASSPSTWRQIGAAIGTTWTFLADWAADLWALVQPGLAAFWTSATAWVQDVDWGTTITDAWTAFTDWAGGAWALVSPKLGEFWTSATAWVQRVDWGKALTEKWTGFTTWAGNVWAQVNPKLTEFWVNAVAWVRSVNWGKAITEKWTGFADWAGNVWAQVNPKLTEFWTNAVAWVQWVDWDKAIGEKWTGFTDWAGNIWAQVQPKLTQFGTDLKAWIDTNAPDFGTWIDSFLAATGDIGEGWSLAWPKIQGYMTTAANSITADLARIKTSLTEIGGWFTGGEGKDFQNSWQTVFEFVAGMISSVVTRSVDNLANLLETISNIGKAVQALSAGDWSKLDEILKRQDELAAQMLRNLGTPLFAPQMPEARAAGGFASGMTLVGERGPELVDLPSGAYVHNADDTTAMLGTGGGNHRLDIYVHGESALPLDRQKLRELAVELRKEFNRSGVMVLG